MGRRAALIQRLSSGRPTRHPGSTVGADRLLSAAQRRLAITTLALLVVLISAVGVTTALLAARSLDAAVDRTLETAATTELDRLHESVGGADATPRPGESGGTDNEAEASAGATTPTAQPAIPVLGGSDPDDHAPAAADTFFLYLDGAGNVTANPERVTLTGLPDRTAVAAASLTGRDLRTTTAGGIHVRLLTLVIPRENGAAGPVRTLQAGFVLTLHDEQSDTLLRSVLTVALAGLIGAAVISVLLTRRALVPVRAAFERERRFVASASHELRTPIALIRSSAEVLGREGRIRPGGAELVSDIVAEADRLGGLVADLSELAVAQARPAVAIAPVDLVALAAAVVRRAGPMANDRSLTLGLGGATPAMPVVVRGDYDRIVQVALILIDNALRHSPNGGVVQVSATLRGGAGELSVRDHGPGIPVAERGRIFEPFAQLDPSGDGGAGLGLAIARAIVEGMGGDIRVDGATGGGSVFSVRFPSA